MRRESRENIAAYLALLMLAGPLCWLLMGIGPRIAPLWCLTAFYVYVVGCTPVAWVVLAAVLDEVLERYFPPGQPT